jgi:hypothetical protein
MKDDGFEDFFKEFLAGLGGARHRMVPDNAHAERARAHQRAALRWPEGLAVRRMHEAAAASDVRLAVEAGR